MERSRRDRDHRAYCSGSGIREADVMAILASLRQEVQWEPYLQRAARRRAELEAANLALWERLVPCDRCGKELPLGEASKHSVGFSHYCALCCEIVRASYQRHCMYCGKTYSVGGIHDYPGRGLACWRADWAKEARRLYVPIERANKAGVPATLKLQQWLKTLDYFEWRCAFCGGPFEAMDHFVPIELGGGTEWFNCLPICRRDNTRKKNRHPDDPAMVVLLPAESTRRIRGYLSRLVSQEKPEGSAQ
jgi:HNH endonuclease